MGRSQYRTASGQAIHKRPTLTPVSFVTAGASNPTVTFGAIASVTRYLQGSIPFWRVELRFDIKLTDYATQFHSSANGTTAPVDGIAQIVRDGLTDDTVGVIPADKKLVQFDVVLLVGGTAVDTAGASIEIAIYHDSI